MLARDPNSDPAAAWKGNLLEVCVPSQTAGVLSSCGPKCQTLGYAFVCRNSVLDIGYKTVAISVSSLTNASCFYCVLGVIMLGKW